MKFMNMKRFGSIAMAGALALSLTAPAFAASTQEKNSTVITGGYEEIPISVTVPTTGTANINPYGLPVKLTKSTDEQVNLVGQQITHEVLAIRNEGDVDLSVSVGSFKVIPKGDVKIDSAKDTGKTIQVDLEIVGLDDGDYAKSPDDESLGDALIDAFIDDATWSSATSITAPTAASPTATPTPAKQDDVVTIGAATVADGEVTAYGDNSIALFRLKGDLAKAPVKSDSSDDPWASTDGFTATVVFKFAPADNTPAVTATITEAANKTSIASGETLSLTVALSDNTKTISSVAWSSDDSSNAYIGALSGTAATQTVTHVSGSGTVVITAVVTYDGGATATATFTMTTT